MPRQEIDKVVLFRQSATLIASGFILILIGKPTQIFVIGIILLLASLFFLITAFLQIWEELHKYTQCVKRLGDSLTLLFLIVTTISVMYAWVKNKNDAAAGNSPGAVLDQQLEPIRQALISGDLIIYLICAFWFVLGVVLFSDIVKRMKDAKAERGFRWMISTVVSGILFIAGIYGISKSTNFSSIWDYILFGLSLLLVAGMMYWMIKLRSTHMDDKEKIRKSAIAIETTADLIDKFLKLPHPPEILKDILKVPLKQLEDELQSLSHDVDSLK